MDGFQSEDSKDGIDLGVWVSYPWEDRPLGQRSNVLILAVILVHMLSGDYGYQEAEICC